MRFYGLPPHSLTLSLSLFLSSFSAHVLSDENRPTTLVGSYLGILYRSNNNYSRPFRTESFAITIKRSINDSCLSVFRSMIKNSNRDNIEKRSNSQIPKF